MSDHDHDHSELELNKDTDKDSSKKRKTIFSVIQSLPSDPYKPLSIVDRKLRDRIVITVIGCILAFNAGWLNVIAIETTKVAVSHVSGTLSVIAVEIIDAKWADLLLRLVTLFAFMFGSFICGILIPCQSFHLSRFYYRAIVLEAICIVIAVIAYSNHYIFNIFLAMACGIQNAITTRYSGNILRTTHHTGTVTDIGVIIGHICAGSGNKEIWKLKILIPLPICFLIGGICGVLTQRSIGSYSLLLNVGIVVSLAIIDAIVMLRKGSKLMDQQPGPDDEPVDPDEESDSAGGLAMQNLDIESNRL